MEILTHTITKTYISTNTKIAVATACLFMAVGFAFLAAPGGNAKTLTKNYYIVTSKPTVTPPPVDSGCSATNFSFASDHCSVIYQQARVQCMDGYAAALAGTCSNSVDYLEQQADVLCVNHCVNGKCGVKKFVIVSSSACAVKYKWGEFSCVGGNQNGTVHRYMGCIANDASFQSYANGVCQTGCVATTTP